MWWPEPTVSPRIHGGVSDAESPAVVAGGSDLLDFSANLNPYGPSPHVMRAVREAELSVYPHPTAAPARAALARSLGVDPGAIVLGNGAADLLWTLAATLSRTGRPALVVEPTFSEFGAAYTAAGGRVVAWRAREEGGFAIDPEAVVRNATEHQSSCLYLCSPNNPTGTMLRAETLAAMATSLPSTAIVLDESFLDLSDHPDDAMYTLPDNVIRVRSLTKMHALPGLRVGYLYATPDIAHRIEAHRPAWSTGAPVQAAAIAIAAEAQFVAESRGRLLAHRDALAVGLTRLGLSPLPSAASFVLAGVGGASANCAAALCGRLLQRHRIALRDCTSFGLPSHVRIAARPPADIQRLLAALEQEL